MDRTEFAMSDPKKKNSVVEKNYWPVIIGAVLIAVIMLASTWWTGEAANESMEEAVRSVSLMYLDELAGRREQVIVSNLHDSVSDISAGISLMDEIDLTDSEHLQSYQRRMKKAFGLERFAFIDTNGTVYTSMGTEPDASKYPFDYRNLSGTKISLTEKGDKGRSVIIAVPIHPISFNGQTFSVCFTQISLDSLLEGMSISSDTDETTFCNIYTKEGSALTDMVLGGLAKEDNLLDALRHARFDSGYSYDKLVENFTSRTEGVASFKYGDINETLYYMPIDGTDWMLTYLIRESVIAERISPISDKIVARNIIQILILGAVLLGFFMMLYRQMRRTAQLNLERETAEAANRAKQEELEEKLALQQQLFEEQEKQTEQSMMITALASDYRSVYYVDLDADKATVYRAFTDLENARKEGESFPYLAEFTEYAESFVDEQYRDGFLAFVQPDNVRRRLEKDPVISFMYLARRNGREFYESLRMAGVRHAADREDHKIHAVGIGFNDVDSETRAAMARARALSDALTAAEEANKAKTAFLSNMSHEIRTPMNAIIGLDNIALSDKNLSEKTREHLEKIGVSAQHLLSIINDILDMSRIESGRMTLKNEEFSMSELLEQVNTMISGQCSDKGLEYHCRINGSLDDYYIGDAVKLKQVIINILGNAVKFTDEGSVEFVVEKIAEFGGKTTLQMTMSDTGIGMSEEYLPKIFDAFSQEDASSINKYGSSGLGLAITKSIVEMMNGNISVQSEKGKGTTFTVQVTLTDSEHRSSGAEAEVNPQEMSVLIVDDDPIACEHARLVLEKVGIAAETAASGAEAVEMVRLRHARRDPYNLILVDWKMPEMDGVETTRRIRSMIGNESAIIILTAYRWDDILDEAVQAGVDSFLAKPLFANNVIDEFKASLRKKGMTSAAVPNKADLRGRRVLVAEDVQVNAEILIMLLGMREIQAEHAVNGREAVEMFESHPEGYYDAIFMDMRMPEMDGLTATETIRAMDRPDSKTIPIIALTANAFDEDVQRSLQAGLNAHLTKPVQPETVYETLESLIPE